MDEQLRPISSSDAQPCQRLLSLITVNLNDAAGLRATAESIARQTYQAYEWLVVDGGSSDGSRDVLRTFEPLIDDWSSEPDQGVYDAMNRGLLRARGQYVMVLNAGDRLANASALERIVGALLDRPGIDLLFAGTILDLPNGRRLYRGPRPAPAWLRFGLPAYHQATIARRVVHLATPFDLDLRISADYGAIATMVKQGAGTARLDGPVVIRDCGPDNLSERETMARFCDFVRVQREILERPWPAVAISLGRLALVHLAFRALGRLGPLPLSAVRTSPRHERSPISAHTADLVPLGAKLAHQLAAGALRFTRWGLDLLKSLSYEGRCFRLMVERREAPDPGSQLRSRADRLRQIHRRVRRMVDGARP